MGAWLGSHMINIIALILGAMFMTASKVFEPHSKGSAPARWFAFGLSAVAGLMLAVGLFPIVRWATGLGSFGAIPAAIGTVVTVLLGWQAFYLIIAAIRDLMDKVPDEEARKAARWVPTFLPAGGTAVVTLMSNPRSAGFGLGVSVITAVIISSITMAYTFKIFKAVDTGRAGKSGWKWFAAVVAFLAGFVHIALISYVDGLLAQVLPGTVMLGIRVVAGVAGILFLVCGFVDWVKDKTPDKYVRLAGVFGVPLVSLFFSIAVAALSKNADSAMQFMAGGR